MSWISGSPGVTFGDARLKKARCYASSKNLCSLHFSNCHFFIQNLFHTKQNNHQTKQLHPIFPIAQFVSHQYSTMTFGNSYGISTSSSCDAHASISSVVEEQKRRSDSLDMDDIVERSSKRKKTCPASYQSSRDNPPGCRQSYFVGIMPFPTPHSSSSSTTLPSKHASR
jgi:hypothetical protein